MTIQIRSSPIHGVGLFATKKYEVNDFIFTAKNKKITYLGSKINHSWYPNTHLLFVNGVWNMYANSIINIDDEITANYNNNRPHFIKPADSNW